MKIDLSIPKTSQQFLFLDIPYKYGMRHFLLAWQTQIPLSLIEKIEHVALGLLHFIPFLNIFSALLESSQDSSHKIITLKGKTPFERGLSFGEQLRSRIQNLYPIILSQIFQDKSFIEERNKLLEHIPLETYRELEGLAKGAQVSLSDVLTIHLFLDIYPGRFGCSVVASNEKEQVVATNHFDCETDNLESIERQSILKEHPMLSLNEKQDAMKAVNKPDTIQSMILNPNEGTIHLASSYGNAADNFWTKYQVFPQKPTQSNSATITRNLDWPWPLLGPETIIVVYDSPHTGKIANVTFPGYIGTLSGMNEKGLSIACSVAGSLKKSGHPITLLFKQILENTGLTQEAENLIERSNPASSMNLTISGNDKLKKVEIIPKQIKALPEPASEKPPTLVPSLLSAYLESISKLFSQWMAF